jgi:hypothetical protein
MTWCLCTATAKLLQVSHKSVHNTSQPSSLDPRIPALIYSRAKPNTTNFHFRDGLASFRAGTCQVLNSQIKYTSPQGSNALENTASDLIRKKRCTEITFRLFLLKTRINMIYRYLPDSLWLGTPTLWSTFAYNDTPQPNFVWSLLYNSPYELGSRHASIVYPHSEAPTIHILYPNLEFQLLFTHGCFRQRFMLSCHSQMVTTTESKSVSA